MPPEAEKLTFTNDAFVSYSRKDREFAAKIEKALKNYKPPKGLNLPQRNLVVFRGSHPSPSAPTGSALPRGAQTVQCGSGTWKLIHY